MKEKNLRIMSKQYAYLHAIAKTFVKFQNDWPKTVGGVALLSQLLTNGQTDERMGHGTPISHLCANTGVTKKGNKEINNSHELKKKTTKKTHVWEDGVRTLSVLRFSVQNENVVMKY